MAWSPRLERAAAELSAAGDQVDPRDRVAVPVVVAATIRSSRESKFGDPLGVHQDALVSIGIRSKVARRMRPVRPIPPIVAHHRSGSDAGRDHADAPVGQQHLDLADVGPERAVGVVALAVDVAGDRARRP